MSVGKLKNFTHTSAIAVHIPAKLIEARSERLSSEAYKIIYFVFFAII
jgi:hypothetical protein